MTKRLPPPTEPFHGLSCVERRHTGHFFDRNTMRFFRSRVSDMVYPSADIVFVVTSEASPNMRRVFSVRRFDAAGEVSTVARGLTRAQAHKEARMCAHVYALTDEARRWVRRRARYLAKRARALAAWIQAHEERTRALETATTTTTTMESP